MEYLRLRDEEEAHLRRQVGQKEAKKLAEGKFRVSRLFLILRPPLSHCSKQVTSMTPHRK